MSYITNVIGITGQNLINRVNTLIGYIVLTYIAFKSMLFDMRVGSKLIRNITSRQIVFTAIDALMMITIISLSVGGIVIMQSERFLPAIGGEKILSELLVMIIMREVGPILTAFLIIGRSCTAMTIEVGYMRVQQEVDALISMGIDPIKFVVIPRIIAMTLSMVTLTVCFNFFALVGGFSFATLILESISFTAMFENLIEALGIFDILLTIIKAFCFGSIVSVIGCFHGMNTKLSITEVPRATINAVVNSLLLCIVANLIITILSI